MTGFFYMFPNVAIFFFIRKKCIVYILKFSSVLYSGFPPESENHHYFHRHKGSGILIYFQKICKIIKCFYVYFYPPSMQNLTYDTFHLFKMYATNLLIRSKFTISIYLFLFHVNVGSYLLLQHLHCFSIFICSVTLTTLTEIPVSKMYSCPNSISGQITSI